MERAVITLTVTYVNMKASRGEWWGETIPRKRRDLWRFAAWLPRRLAADITAIKQHHVQRYFDELRVAASTKRVRLSTLRGFFGWCHRCQHIHRDPTDDIHVPDVPESPPRAFGDTDTDTLFAAAAHDPRYLLLVSFAWNEGLRCVEIARALREDVDWRARTMSVRGKFYRGDVSRRIAVSRATLDALDAYLATAPGATGPIVRSRLDPARGLTAGHVARLITDVIRVAGLKRAAWDGRSPHAGRHTSAAQALEAGARPEHMKRQYGWKSDSMISRYGAAAALDLHEIHELRDERRRRLASEDDRYLRMGDR